MCRGFAREVSALHFLIPMGLTGIPPPWCNGGILCNCVCVVQLEEAHMQTYGGDCIALWGDLDHSDKKKSSCIGYVWGSSSSAWACKSILEVECEQKQTHTNTHTPYSINTQTSRFMWQCSVCDRFATLKRHTDDVCGSSIAEGQIRKYVGEETDKTVFLLSNININLGFYGENEVWDCVSVNIFGSVA